jgi:hypothetical protein
MNLSYQDDVDYVPEVAPFLGEQTDIEDHHVDSPSHERQLRAAKATLGLLGFVVFCLSLSGTMVLIPLGRLIEDVICRQHYGTSGTIDESQCKVDEVQARLAWLGGWTAAIDSVACESNTV